ncbi:MAG: ABC transporter ATP-binding protein [Dehalococcoidales bacterium]|nr:MAG: ABC transporter ATP-binding protein [Dehalococcoidales bacterium]
MNEIIVETRNLTKVFSVGESRISAVNGIDLTIGRGEFVSIMGPSGSGKTTLLNLLGGLDYPSSGSILFEGQDMGKLKERDLDNLRLRRMGFIFQTFNLMPIFTALENVTLPMEIAGVPRDERLAKAKSLLTQLGLSERIYHRPHQLSAGENQRVAIARALANSPSLLLADEPTGNLDSRTTEEIAGLLKQLNSEYNIAIALVTHDVQVGQVASRTLHMVDGRLQQT